MRGECSTLRQDWRLQKSIVHSLFIRLNNYMDEPANARQSNLPMASYIEAIIFGVRVVINFHQVVHNFSDLGLIIGRFLVVNQIACDLVELNAS